MKKILLLIVLSFMIVSVSAQIQDLGTFKMHDCVELIQTCSNCSYVNITSVKYPSSVQALGNVNMTKTGTVYTYDFCSANYSGTYVVSGVGDVDGTDTVFAYTFDVTPSGYENQYIFLILVGVVCISVIILGIKTEDYWIIMFGGILILLSGFYVLIYGIDVVKDVMTTRAIGFILWGIGIYMIIRAAIEQLKIGG